MPKPNDRSLERMKKHRIWPLRSYKKTLNTPVYSGYWWRHGVESANFGDELSPRLFELATGFRLSWQTPETCQIFGVGSILDLVSSDTDNRNRPVIWGSGFIRPGESTVFEDHSASRIVAVRGELSRSRVSRAGSGDLDQVVLGDPGLLANRLLSGNVSKAFEIGFVPHHSELFRDEINLLRELGIEIISPLEDSQIVIEKIAACNVVLSSSLHGLIVADSLGVPNVHLIVSDHVEGGTYKFDDYYSAFPQRQFWRLEISELFHRLSERDKFMHDVDNRYEPIENLVLIQTNLVKALRDALQDADMIPLNRFSEI